MILNLQMDASLATQFKSASQQARVVTEAWAAHSLYCVCCNSNRLIAAPNNAQAIDFTCKRCDAPFQLKSQASPLGYRVTDSGYEAMCRAIRSDRVPNLVVMHYDRWSWQVKDVVLIPSFGFTLSSIEKRKPLALTARRAGWVGCNILLGMIPDDLRLPLIENSSLTNPSQVREQYRAMSAFRELTVQSRGWLFEVLTLARSLRRLEFELRDLYALEGKLQKLHPNNLHIRPKIRQQLQVLRDHGVIEFLGDGNYRLTSETV